MLEIRRSIARASRSESRLVNAFSKGVGAVKFLSVTVEHVSPHIEREIIAFTNVTQSYTHLGGGGGGGDGGGGGEGEEGEEIGGFAIFSMSLWRGI